MPENDILRFVIILAILLFIVALLFKILDDWHERGKHRLQIEEVKARLKIQENEEDDDQDNSEVD